MRLSSFVGLLVVAAVAAAQNQTVMIAVGGESNTPGGIFQFIPNNATAPNGTVVTFQFSGIPGNHSVTQSSFDSPCEPLAGGFDSGWILIEAATTPLPTWTITIENDQTPIWFYCKQLNPSPHCIAGMVGGINIQPGANSITAFQAKAASAGSSGQGQNGLVGVGASASAEPLVPSGATHFLGVSISASATAPAGGSSAAGGSTTAGGSSASSSSTGTPSNAIPMAVNLNFLVVLLGMFAGAMMVL
ncbi:hypothetical protein DFH07DRAFT_992990 [Mycena maculata]|uniref:Extracellular serine-rich protein n=1 Tax=Mycena maculata TaxID=230809 RepID=A0AAD7MU04_9AGAR|nr:hypothetical protein DFH07DRAFT_992990 [Mycena maculata]